MITVLSANFAQVSATQTEFWCKLNYQIEPKTNKGKRDAKQHANNDDDANNGTKQVQ